MVRGSGPWWGDAENAQGRSDTFDLGAKTDDRGQVGGVGRAVGDQTPWGGGYMSSGSWGHAVPLPLFAGFFLMLVNFTEALYHQ